MERVSDVFDYSSGGRRGSNDGQVPTVSDVFDYSSGSQCESNDGQVPIDLILYNKFYVENTEQAEVIRKLQVKYYVNDKIYKLNNR